MSLRCRSLIGVIILGIALMVPLGVKADSVPAGNCAIYSGTNRALNDYSVYKPVITSYLIDTGEGYMRFQKLSDADTFYLIQYYDYDYKYMYEKQVVVELPLFGAFYDDGSYYYVLSGQMNNVKNDSVETYRLTKYSHDFTRISQLSMCANNTTVPFDHGTARMVNDGNLLFIRTAHKQYSGHQANAQFMIDTDTMTLVESLTEASDAAHGYLSHSFNQFVILDGGRLVGCDQSDGLPRSINFSWYKNLYSDTSYGKDGGAYCVDLLNIPGSFGNNYTNCSIGGFVKTSSRYMAVGNCTDFSNYTGSSTRNIFVATCIMDGFVKDIKYVTNYNEGEESVSTPYLIGLEDGTYFLLWEQGDTLYSCVLDHEGNAGEIVGCSGKLSDCEPLYRDGKIVWYVWENERIMFYTLDVMTYEVSEKTLVFGHQYSYTTATLANPYFTRTCITCGNTRTMRASTDYDVYMSVNGDAYRCTPTVSINCCDSLSYMVWDNCYCDYNVVEISSSDTDIVVYKNGKFVVGGKEGVASVKFAIAHFPDMYRVVNVSVTHNYDQIIYVPPEVGIPGYKSAVCSACGESMFLETYDPLPEPEPEIEYDSPEIKGVRVSLEGDLTVIIELSNVPIGVVRIDGPNGEMLGFFYENYECASLSYSVAAKDMGELINVSFWDFYCVDKKTFTDGISDFVFSVYDYLVVLENTTDDDKIKNLSESLRHYGMNAACYFNGEGEYYDEFDDVIIEDTMRTSFRDDILKDPVTGEETVNIQGTDMLLGVSLILEYKISIRLYFADTNGIIKNVLIDGVNACVEQVGNGIYYVEIDDICLSELDVCHTISAGYFDVEGLSVLSYCARCIDYGGASEELQRLCISLYKCYESISDYQGK